MMGSLGDLPGPPTRAFSHPQKSLSLPGPPTRTFSEKSSLRTFPCLCWVYCAVSTDLLKFEAAVSKQTKKCWRGGKFRKKGKKTVRSIGILHASDLTEPFQSPVGLYFGGSWQFENHPVHSELITGLLLGMHYNIIETDFNMFWACKIAIKHKITEKLMHQWFVINRAGASRSSTYMSAHCSG